MKLTNFNILLAFPTFGNKSDFRMTMKFSESQTLYLLTINNKLDETKFQRVSFRMSLDRKCLMWLIF